MTVVKAVGYARVSTDKQADRGVSLDAQTEKIRAMAVVHSATLVDLIVDGGESAKSLIRRGMTRLLAMVEAGEVHTVLVAKLDRLTRSVKDLCTLLERFERRGVALVSVAESLDTGSAAGRLVLNIMTAVSQWEREAIGERTRDALHHKRTNGERVGNIAFGSRLASDGEHLEPDPDVTFLFARSALGMPADFLAVAAFFALAFLPGLRLALDCSAWFAAAAFSIISLLIGFSRPGCGRHIDHSGSEKLQVNLRLRRAVQIKHQLAAFGAFYRPDKTKSSLKRRS